MRIQAREAHLLTTDLETELWEIENGQRRVISDAAAVTIAAWYQSGGPVGYVLAALASGCEVDHCDLLADIGNTEATQTSAELRHLVAWVVATMRAADLPEAGRNQPESRWAATERAYAEREKQARDSLAADANGRQAGHGAARDAGPNSAAVREELAEEHGNGGYPDGSLAADYRAGFAFGWATWTSHRATRTASDPAPFQAYDPAALAVCLKTYDALQPIADEAAELYAKAETDRSVYAAAEEKGRSYDIEARLLLDGVVTALRGPVRPERVHYTELAEGDIVTEAETQFRVIARGEEIRGHLVQWVSTEAVTEPGNQLHPFVNQIGDSWRLQSREDLAYTYRIAPENPLTY